jgi:mannosyltransferase OCH1-like enzyme
MIRTVLFSKTGIAVCLSLIFLNYFFFHSSLRPLRQWSDTGTYLNYSTFEYHPAAPSNNLTQAPFLDKIWQVDIGNQMNDENKENLQTWLELNPTFRHEIITGLSAEKYVRKYFSHRPDLLDPYLALEDTILRADVLRLLILLADGGVYTDLDVKCSLPIDQWLSAEDKEKASVVVGIELDRPEDEDTETRVATWTIYGRAGSRALEHTILAIYKNLRDLAAKKSATLGTLGSSQFGLTFWDIMVTTGPNAVTVGLLESASRDLGTTLHARNISNLTAPKLLSDVLVLPINAFNNGQPWGHSGEPDRGTELLRHKFKGTWIPSHQG